MVLRIGHFALLCQLPVKTLRFYDEIGLFCPAHVDRFTGYRYYALEQLPTLHRILALKDLGLSLEQIGRMMNGDVSAAMLREMLLARRSHLQAQAEAVAAEIQRVEARLRQLEREDMNVMATYEIVLKRVEPMRVAAQRIHIPTNEQVPELLGPAFREVWEYLQQQGVKRVGTALAVWHSPAEALTDEEVEAAYPIAPAEQVVGNERIKVYELPGEEVAAVVHHGEFSEFQQGLQALLSWIENNRYRITGPYRELYIQHDPQNLAESTTEIQFPVEKASV